MINGGFQMRGAAASYVSRSIQKRVMMGLCKPKETGLRLKSLGLTGPNSPPERTLGSLPELVFRKSHADEEGPVP